MYRLITVAAEVEVHSVATCGYGVRRGLVLGLEGGRVGWGSAVVSLLYEPSFQTPLAMRTQTKQTKKD